MDVRTRGQAERGIYMPRAQLASSITLMRGLRTSLNSILRPATERLTRLDTATVAMRIDAVIKANLLPAFDALISYLEDDAYAAAAPEAVDLAQYPGGREAYDELVKIHTTLVPGHHFHLASQCENETLHPLRKYTFFNAYNEGWAEYAATLAGEMGMYATPEERFGRMMQDSFLTCRLVVDTGMNASDGVWNRLATICSNIASCRRPRYNRRRSAIRAEFRHNRSLTSWAIHSCWSSASGCGAHSATASTFATFMRRYWQPARCRSRFLPIILRRRSSV